jgi:hypothetical protein
MMANHANLLLPYVCDNPAIMMATHTNSKLQLVVGFTLILHSEGAPTPLSMLIVACVYSKTSFYFCKDCRICCEGEWEMKNDGNATVKQ